MLVSFDSFDKQRYPVLTGAKMTKNNLMAHLLCLFSLFGCNAEQQDGQKAMTVEAGCAMCIYEMDGIDKCTLAVKIDDKTYLVKGSAMLDHGDAHEDDGMCMTARQALVDGRIEDGYFFADEFQLIPKK